MGGAKAAWARFARTRVWRAWKRYGDQRGNRLAGSATYFGFLSLFPLMVLAIAIAAAVLNKQQVANVTKALKTSLPGIGDQIDFASLAQHAGSIGLIGAVSLLLTGLGWVDALRASIRNMWALPDQPGNAVTLKIADFFALLGLGIVGIVSNSASSLVGLSKTLVAKLGWEHYAAAHWFFVGLGWVVAVLAGALLMGYIQSGFPRIRVERKVLLWTSLVGGLIVEALKQFGTKYVGMLIEKNAAYGALAVPLALLVWIFLVMRITMLLSAYICEWDHDKRKEDRRRVEISAATRELERRLATKHALQRQAERRRAFAEQGDLIERGLWSTGAIFGGYAVLRDLLNRRKSRR